MYQKIVAMEHTAENQTATPESVWAAFRETDRQIKESGARFDREMAESNARFDSRMAESDARFDRRMAESSAKFDRDMAASRAEFDKRSADFDRRMKNLDEMIGGVSNSNGTFAEEFFFNALEMGDKNLFGEHFDQCLSLVKRFNKENQKKGEHDILLINGKSVALIEVKYRARKEDVQKIVNRLPNFRALFSEYKNHRIFLGLAAMSFTKGVEEESVKKGVAILKQVGDTVLFNDANIKVY